jgi:hypothetical protein
MNKPRKIKIKWIHVKDKDSEERLNHAYDLIFNKAFKNVVERKRELRRTST